MNIFKKKDKPIFYKKEISSCRIVIAITILALIIYELC